MNTSKVYESCQTLTTEMSTHPTLDLKSIYLHIQKLDQISYVIHTRGAIFHT